LRVALAGVVDGPGQGHSAPAGYRAEPMAIRAVSPNEMTTSRGSTDQVSATTWAKMVSIPCPWEQAPDVTYIDPVGFNPHDCTLKWPNAGALDVACNAKTEIAA